MSIVERAMDKLRHRAVDTATVSPATTTEATDTANVALAQHQTSSAVKAQVSRPALTLDRVALREAGLLPPEAEERRMADEYRRIKRPIVSRARESVANAKSDAGVVVVASAIPGEGKTFTTLNLALSLAREQDTSVLVIDADIAKPHLTGQLGIADKPGLMDALTDDSLSIEELVHQTDVPNLFVLGAGRHAANATEILASERMRDLVARLRTTDPRRIVLFDSPPLLLTTESRELAVIAGQVVLVVRAEFTPRRAVMDAIEQLGPGSQVGLVLNGFSRGGAGEGYYGYGEYGTYGTRPASSAAVR